LNETKNLYLLYIYTSYDFIRIKIYFFKAKEHLILFTFSCNDDIHNYYNIILLTDFIKKILYSLTYLYNSLTLTVFSSRD
jgi:hypothetical protein